MLVYVGDLTRLRRKPSGHIWLSGLSGGYLSIIVIARRRVYCSEFDAARPPPKRAMLSQCVRDGMGGIVLGNWF